MDIIPRPVFPPGQCIATCKSEDPKGFIDTYLTPALAGDNRIIVSVTWVEECASKLGWLSPADAADLRGELDAARERVSEVEGELQEADRFAEAAEYTLRHIGEKVRRKPGRKPQREAA